MINPTPLPNGVNLVSQYICAVVIISFPIFYVLSFVCFQMPLYGSRRSPGAWKNTPTNAGTLASDSVATLTPRKKSRSSLRE
jgi:hypothetical protein